MAFSDPAENVERFGITDGMYIADFGSGSGHYSLALAEAVGDSGRVYAIDVQQELLKKVKDLSRAEHRNNIEALWGNVEKLGGSKLREGSVDGVVIANALFQFEDKDAALAEARRILKPKGRLFLIDWSESFGGLGPQPEHVVPADAAKGLAEKAGFAFVNDISAGDHHYGLIFRKQ